MSSSQLAALHEAVFSTLSNEVPDDVDVDALTGRVIDSVRAVVLHPQWEDLDVDE